MGGQGSGGYRKNALPDKSNPIKQAADMTNVDPEANNKALRFTAEILTWPEVDYKDADAMRQRFADFLDLCAAYGIKPQVQTAALAFGMNRDTFSKIARGDKGYSNWHHGALTPESRLVIQKCYESLAAIWEISLLEERGNPVKWIFVGKNYHGMRDQSEHIIAKQEPEVELPDVESVHEKYAKMVGRPLIITDGEE